MPTPENSLVNARFSGAAFPAVARLRKYLSSGKDAETAFRQWRTNPVTRMFVNALAEFADAPDPIELSDDGVQSVLVKYGMSSGLSMALKLVSQPYRIFPEAFKGNGADVSDSILDQSYVDEPDSAIDSL